MTAEISVSQNAGGGENTGGIGSALISGIGENGGGAGRGLVSRIRESYETLTATEREAAQYILGHLTDVLVCNSVELSQLSGVSQPTLSRLYRKLGYANAGEFRRDVRRMHQPGAPEIARTEQCDDLLDDHLRRDEESLRHTFEGIDRGRLECVCQAMAKASRIAVIGFRNSYPVALHLREQLLQLRGNVDILPHPGQSVAEEIADLTSQDVVVVVGVRRRPVFFPRLVDVLLERGVNVVVIGDVSVKSALVGRNVTLFEVDLNSHLLSSFTAAFAFVALLADEVGERLAEAGEVSGRIERINGYFSDIGELEGC
ncbi:MurR/RpiR family transcriptional regulator [Bifidobacterium moukalabense]|uniref:MurR/RpiR family transcriptional regulator n=1 Tax=Bifidobacterium moukalabense TaxID=1333651 RepID=UPI0010F540BF|nr:MurR/RpiR family transcriptional regulator [Bifidobacterium moukalabense]